MGDNESQYLEAFGSWLSHLGEDAEQLSLVLTVEDTAQAARQSVAGGLNYLFKSLDLIPDGIDDIGYLDDAFVLRVAAEHAAASSSEPVLTRLSQEAQLVKGFLGDNYARLDGYVSGLRTGAARGRTVQEILGSEKMLEDFLAEVRGFAGNYQPPHFSRDPKSLIKLRAFFDAKLPK
ncbi:MAG TPA: YkvA family protein [Polyangiales bacterium]